MCKDHLESFTSHLQAQNWTARSSRLEFAVWNRNYAKELLAVNLRTDPDHIKRQAESSPLLYDIKNGKRFVVYQYAVSALVVSLIHVSAVQVLGPGQSALVRGLRYSALSLIAGWWGIPAGPIFTIACIIRNCRGGIDLTRTVAAVICGTAVSGGGY